MGLIQRLLKGSKSDKAEFKKKLKAAQEEDRINELIMERKKSSNHRALEKEMKRNEEAQITEALRKIDRRKDKETWSSKKKILDNGTSILRDDRPILKEKNIFMNNPNMFSTSHSKRNKTDMGFWNKGGLR